MFKGFCVKMKEARKGGGEEKMKKKDWLLISQLFMGGAFIAVLFAAIGYTGNDIWLASTQWLLVALVLSVFGLYTRMNA